MPMYWTFNCFLGCIYTVYRQYINFRKKRTKLPESGAWGGGLGNSGNARKKTFVFNWPLPLRLSWCLSSPQAFWSLLIEGKMIVYLTRSLDAVKAPINKKRRHWTVRCLGKKCLVFNCLKSLPSICQLIKGQQTIVMCWILNQLWITVQYY